MSIPGLESASRLVEENRKLFSTASCSFHGRSLSDLQSAARTDAIRLAHAFTSELLQTDIAKPSTNSCVVTGHQPELFHVGVWAKNFALDGVARRTHSVAVNLIIDNDTLNRTSIRIPTGTRESLRTEQVSFDKPRAPLPWEEATIQDQELFRQFGSQIQRRMQATWDFDPLIHVAWEAAVQRSLQSHRLSDGLTAFRVQLERRWGQTNLELPMSRLCETEPFLWFVSHLLMRLPELHSAYNAAVAEYRREHRLRNRMQPVPDLEQDQDWFEVPFWVWRHGDNQRGRLFARHAGGYCELRDQTSLIAQLPLADNVSLNRVVETLNQLSVRGIRLRTRALTTTLFARVCLADLFVHGIGGAKYDSMTDQLCERLFGLRAPQFLTVSATLYLPLGGPFAATKLQLHEINQRIRDLKYNPDRHLSDPAPLAELIQEKTDLLAAAQQLRDSRQLKGHLTSALHQRLAEIRAEIQTHTSDQGFAYESQRSTIQSQLSGNELLKNREFSFALYPEELVREFLVPLHNFT